MLLGWQEKVQSGSFDNSLWNISLAACLLSIFIIPKNKPSYDSTNFFMNCNYPDNQLPQHLVC